MLSLFKVSILCGVIFTSLAANSENPVMEITVELNSKFKIELHIKSLKREKKTVKLSKVFVPIATPIEGYKITAKKLSNFEGLSTVEADLNKNEDSRYKIESAKDVTILSYEWGKIFNYSTPTKGARFYHYVAPNNSSVALVIKDYGDLSGVDLKSVKIIK
jgi:hypothetical protein